MVRLHCTKGLKDQKIKVLRGILVLIINFINVSSNLYILNYIFYNSKNKTYYQTGSEFITFKKNQ